MNVRMYECVCTMYVCMYVCMYVRIYVRKFLGLIPHDSSVLSNCPRLEDNVVAYSKVRIFTRNLSTAGNEHSPTTCWGLHSLGKRH
jgi:hypothetical protein